MVNGSPTRRRDDFDPFLALLLFPLSSHARYPAHQGTTLFTSGRLDTTSTDHNSISNSIGPTPFPFPTKPRSGGETRPSTLCSPASVLPFRSLETPSAFIVNDRPTDRFCLLRPWFRTCVSSDPSSGIRPASTITTPRGVAKEVHRQIHNRSSQGLRGSFLVLHSSLLSTVSGVDLLFLSSAFISPIVSLPSPCVSSPRTP